MRKHLLFPAFIAILLLISLACTLSRTATPDTGVINTQIALGMTQTAMNQPPAQGFPTSIPALPTQAPDLLSTQVAMAMTQTAISAPPLATSAPLPTDTLAAPTAQDLQTRIDASNILVYEDVAGDSSFIPYVKNALKSVGGYHKYDADAMGTFMSDMNSGTKWDLIIVASELRTSISGDYWTVLKTQVDKGAALVTEIWYLNDINSGMIAPFLSECGLALQSDWQAKATYNPIYYGMYWVDPTSPVFNVPNKVKAFGASLSTDAAWMYGDLGDLMQVTDSSKAHILATQHAGEQSDYGLISECMNGQVLFQTFSSHNYPTNDMTALWNNYIIYTLTNHFKLH